MSSSHYKTVLDFLYPISQTLKHALVKSYSSTTSHHCASPKRNPPGTGTHCPLKMQLPIPQALPSCLPHPQPIIFSTSYSPSRELLPQVLHVTARSRVPSKRSPFSSVLACPSTWPSKRALQLATSHHPTVPTRTKTPSTINSQ